VHVSPRILTPHGTPIVLDAPAMRGKNLHKTCR
jgi:hypothetical protein